MSISSIKNEYSGSSIFLPPKVDFEGLIEEDNLISGIDYIVSDLIYVNKDVGTNKKANITVEILSTPLTNNYTFKIE